VCRVAKLLHFPLHEGFSPRFERVSLERITSELALSVPPRAAPRSLPKLLSRVDVISGQRPKRTDADSLSSPPFCYSCRRKEEQEIKHPHKNRVIMSAPQSVEKVQGQHEQQDEGESSFCLAAYTGSDDSSADKTRETRSDTVHTALVQASDVPSTPTKPLAPS
jgi:hypothetical protein